MATESQQESTCNFRNLVNESTQPMVPSNRAWPIMRSDKIWRYMVGSGSVSWGGPGWCSVTIGWPNKVNARLRLDLRADPWSDRSGRTAVQALNQSASNGGFSNRGF